MVGDPSCLRPAEVSEADTFLDFALKLHTGYRLRQWFATGVRALESGLPTQTLRNLVKRAHRAAHQIEAVLPAPAARPRRDTGGAEATNVASGEKHSFGSAKAT